MHKAFGQVSQLKVGGSSTRIKFLPQGVTNSLLAFSEESDYSPTESCTKEILLL